MKKILIVEDDQIVANIYRNKLSVEGYQVELAADGQAGLELMREFRPDAVILDLMLPKVSGVELTKKVRALPEFQGLPIIVFSNTYLTNMVQQAWKAGATKCLSKASCSPKQLLDVIRNTVGSNGIVYSPQPAASPAQAENDHSHTKPVVSAPVSHRPSREVSPEALQKKFVDSLPDTLSALRTLVQSLNKGDDQDQRINQVYDLHRRVHALTGNAALTGMLLIAKLSEAFEALLDELQQKPANLNASTLRTIAGATDFLGVLFEHGLAPNKQELPPVKILVVDDEPASRRAVVAALEKAKLKSTAVEDPEVAYTLLSETRFDLIFLDIDMPGMNGFELCSKLRTLPAQKATPIVFVTGLNGFENRASSMMSGGTDFIAKPFLFMELAVKALIYVLRGKLGLGGPSK